MAFDKFDWIRVVVGDRRLKVAERFVLTNAAIVYVRHGDNVLRVRQTTVADRFAVGVRTVRGSFSQARQLGYLVLAEPRQRGRSHHGPDEHHLVIPANAAAINEEIPAQYDPNSGTDRPEYRQNTTEIAAERKPLTSKNADPKGFLKGSLKGRGEGGATPTPISIEKQNKPASQTPVNDDEVPHPVPWHEYLEKGWAPGIELERPSRYCNDHPQGVSTPCGACGSRREERAEWDKAHQEWEDYCKEFNDDIQRCRHCNYAGQYVSPEGDLLWCEHIAPNVRDCPLCDDYGWLLGPDAAVTDRAVWCQHPKPDPVTPAKPWPAWRGVGSDPFENYA